MHAKELHAQVFELAHSFVVRKYKEDDEKGIVELMGLCFGRTDYDYWMKHWVWEYKENPLGKHIWIAERNGQVVAHSAWIPVNLKVGKKVFKSGIGADAMTHPNYRRKGLQWKIIAIAQNELVKASIYFSYFFPGEAFHKHRRDGQYSVCKIPVMIKFFDTNEIIKKLIHCGFLARVISVFLNRIIGVFFRSKKKSISEDLKITRVAQFDDRIDEFWKYVSNYFGIIVVRNKEYLNWRYFKRPNSNFNILLAEDDDKILGYIVFSSHDKKGFFVDLLVYPNRLDVIQSLVSMAVEQLREEKVHRIICQIPKINPYYKVLRANGFIPFSGKYPFAVSIYSPSNIPTEFIKNPKNWYITMGDTDGIQLGY